MRNMIWYILLPMLLLTTVVNGQTTGCRRLYVDSSVTTSGNGNSWATAFKTVSQALDSANKGSCSSREIWVAKGTYYPMAGLTTIAGSRDSSFRILRNGIKIYGGFSGTETLLSARNIATNPTVLSGDIGVLGDSTDNTYTLVIVRSNNTIDTNTRIDGLIVKRGSNGMVNQYSSPTITNCTFSYNSSTSSDGGGMYNSYYSSPSINNCTFSNNSSSYGGGMYNYYYSSPSINNCTFSNNSSTYYGGGMENANSSSPSITNCIFSNNSSLYGGGIYNYFSEPSISNCVFSSNNSSSSGGGIYSYNSYNSTQQVKNSTFYNNSSPYGGAICNYLSSITLTNCVLWGNDASVGGPDIYDMGTFTSNYYCITQTPQFGAGNSTANPLFVDSANAIGPDGIWRTSDDGLRLKSCSPAVNTGNNNAVPAGITTDVTGALRIQNITVDKGAYEMNYNYAGVLSTTVSVIPVCSNTNPATFTAATTVPSSISTYQWYKNGVSVGSNKDTFILNNWSSNDSVWVVHTNDCNGKDTSTKKYVQLAVAPVQPGAIAGDTTPCPGTRIYAVAAVPGAATYTWSVPAGWTITAGQGTDSIIVAATTAAGNLTVTANNSCGTASVVRTLAVVPLTAPPTPAPPVGPAAVCAASIGNVYSTQTVSGAILYTWAVPAGWTITAGQGTNSITLTSAAGNTSGTIIVTAGNGCQTSDSAIRTVTGETSIAPTIAISKNTGDTVCQGTPVTFTATPTIGGASPIYQWYINSTSMSGATGPTYTYSGFASGDSVSVVLHSTATCRLGDTARSSSLKLTVQPTVASTVTVSAYPGTSIPAGTTVTFTAHAIPASLSTIYQWFKNGTPVAGARDSFYTTNDLQEGDLILVQVDSLGFCATPDNLTSIPLRISDPAGIAAVNNGWEGVLSLYPNPNGGRFTVSADWGVRPSDARVKIELVNGLGQQVYESEAVSKGGNWSIEVQLSEGIANGVYMLRLKRESDGSTIAKPVMIQR